MLEHTLARFDIKAIQPEQRLITGYANTWAGPDLNGDVTSRHAFDNFLSTHRPEDIAVLIGHNTQSLPVGVCIDARPDDTGLLTTSQIFPTTAGDDLLATARALKAKGQALGLSIGFQTKDAGWESKDGTTFRVLKEVDLMEYSFAAPQLIANPTSLVTSVKRTSLRDETKHGAIQVPADVAQGAKRTYRWLKGVGANVHAGNIGALLRHHGIEPDVDDIADNDDRQRAGTNDNRFSGWQ